jgi:hypothetical protein
MVVIARLDRLARNVALISKLMESGVEFVAADFPQANRLTIHILAGQSPNMKPGRSLSGPRPRLAGNYRESWKVPVRFRVSVVVAALLHTGCNANQEVDPSSRTAPGVVAGPTRTISKPDQLSMEIPGQTSEEIDTQARRG